MKKRGFTLIELLAVIVILAIIAIIAVPLVLNIINDSKEKAFENSVEHIKKAAELKVANMLLNDEEITNSIIFKIEDLDLENKERFTGTVEVVINEKNSLKTKLNVTDGKYCANKSINSDEVVVTKCDEEDDDLAGTNLGYQVIFKVNDEAYYASSCKQGGSIVEPLQPTKAGYTFAGWKDSDNHIVPFPYTPTKSTTLTAYFTNTHTIVNYIKSTGTQYIDLDYIPNENTKIVFTVSDISYTNINTVMISASNTWVNSIFCFVYHTYGGFRWMASSSNVYFKKDLNGPRATIELYRNYVKYNDEIINNDTTNWNYGNVVSLRLFKDPRITDPYVGETTFKLYGLTIYENNTIIKKFVPIYHNDLKKAGLYEEISKTYYFNQNSNTTDFVYE